MSEGRIAPAWPRSLDPRFGPPAPGQYRAQADDFIVEEVLGFVPEGDGEHLWLHIEKRNQTTLDVVRTLAKACEVRSRDIGYAGMKDRIAVTRQWLSIHLPGKAAPDALGEILAARGIKVLVQARHPRKLKRGVHRANRFRLRVTGEAIATEAFALRWDALCRQGVPNYFGPQRFGPGGRNLARARQVLARGWRKKDDREGMLLSSARSFLFNEVLGKRVQAATWGVPLVGDVMMLEGTASIFTADEVDESLLLRARELDVHPTGVLWGTGGATVSADEAWLRDTHPALCQGLEAAGVKRARRALRMRLDEPQLTRTDEAVSLHFSLPRGGFATAVLAELIEHPDFATMAMGGSF
ncbi:tRNA pseudouridine(13) synthase TruD [Halomonas sp. Bachu 37]|uniref:tRNA pseudouridine(13) synthase TruD n=1 Tax=Halomonas kashgarensis TaxID=3084920 RepID=UPI0032167377